jgi:FkbM family methyltransferase
MPSVMTSTRTRLPSLSSRLARARSLAWLSRAGIRYLVKRRTARYGRRVVSHSYGSQELTISLEDPVAEEWYDYDWPLPPELVRLRESRLVAGARVFDVGAHQGVVALMLSRLAGPEGQVVGVEAERHNFEVACRNRDLNGAGNLELIHAAGAAQDGWLHFSDRLNGTVVKHGRVGLSRVRSLSVDGLAERYGRPDVVFVDVEGFEHEVLSGARRTIAAGASDFFVEVHVGYGLEDLGGSTRLVLEHFDRDDFRLLVSRAGNALDDYELLPLDEHPEVLRDRFFLLALAR